MDTTNLRSLANKLHVMHRQSTAWFVDNKSARRQMELLERDIIAEVLHVFPEEIDEQTEEV